MKPCFTLFFLAGFFLGCSKNSDQKIREQVTLVAENYLMSQLPNPQKKISDNGLITISDNQNKYIIEPSKIFLGLIDDDSKKDAIISVATFHAEYQSVSEQLVILKTDKDFMVVSAIESDMKIISLKDRVITADVPEHSRNNPLFNCQSCWEVVNFQYNNGELLRMK